MSRGFFAGDSCDPGKVVVEILASELFNGREVLELFEMESSIR